MTNQTVCCYAVTLTAEEGDYLDYPEGKGTIAPLFILVTLTAPQGVSLGNGNYCTIRA